MRMKMRMTRNKLMVGGDDTREVLIVHAFIAGASAE